MSTVTQDLRYALRALRKSPGFTLTAVLALALGIGANTAVFTSVYAFLLRPLPYAEPDQLVRVTDQNITDPGSGSASWPTFQDWRQRNHVFAELFAYDWVDRNLTGPDQPERLRGIAATAGIFDVLGVAPTLGRGYTSAEDTPETANIVVLGHDVWQTRFGGEPGILGGTVTLDGLPHTIVGVMPRGFYFPDRRSQFWVPIALDEQAAPRARRYLKVDGRLLPGVSLAKAAAEMRTIASQIALEHPSTNSNRTAGVVRLHDYMARKPRPALLTLLAAVGFLLLIACANIANLLLARATRRSREIALRAALGASRGRIVRQLLTESVLLSTLAGAAGILVAIWINSLTVAAMPLRIRPVEPIALDATVLLFTLVLSMVTGIVFGLAPALSATRASLNSALRESGRGLGAGRGRLRNVLVISEVALAAILLIGAGLLLKSLDGLLRLDPGFRPENVVTAKLRLAPSLYSEPAQQTRFRQQLLERVRALPGVQSAALSRLLPLDGSNSRGSFVIEPPPVLQSRARLQDRYTSPGHFATMGIPLLRGRLFSDEDSAGRLPVVLISQTMAERYWPGLDPIGRRIKMAADPSSPQPWLTIVGIVGNTRYSGLAEPPEPEAYLPLAQTSASTIHLTVRTTSPPAQLAGPLRAIVREVDHNQPFTSVRTMQSIVDESLAPARITSSLLGIFSALALLLAALGLYGLISYSVAQRTHEIGVRMALGAAQTNLVGLILYKGFQLTLGGILIGLTAALGVTRLLSALLYGVSPTDTGVFLAVPAFLIVVALLASAIPALRATRISPTAALRHE